MQAIKIIILLCLSLGVSFSAQAKRIDHVGTVQEADRFGAQSDYPTEAGVKGSVAKANRTMKPLAQKPKSTFDKVKGWLSQKRKSWFPSAEEKQIAQKEKEAQQRKVEKKKQIKSLEASLPNYITKEKGITKDQLKAAKDTVSKLGTKVVAPAMAPDAELPLDKAGVPVVKAFEKRKKGKKRIPRVKKKIALLNVGRPEAIEASELTLQGFTPVKVSEKNAQALPSPGVYPKEKTMAVIAQSGFKNALEPEDPRNKVQFESKLVTKKMVEAIKIVTENDRPIELRAYSEITTNQFKLLAAMILYNKGKCQVVMGLFDELRAVEDLKETATFHLGACAQKLKLYSTGYHYLSQLIKAENAEYSEKSLLMLAKKLPRDYEEEFADMVLGLKNKGIITKKIEDAVFYRVAKGSYYAGKLKTAKVYSEKVSKKSKFYLDARYIKAVSDYSIGNMAAAEKEMVSIRKKLLRSGSNDNMLSVTATNLARIQFQQGKFAEAVKTFGKVKKDHALWVTALVEQGWAQVMVEDPAGAIGNMYSLHSPFFRGVYKPESYVVRTIGYLNLCQYGDAYKTLSMMEDTYRPWNDRLSLYIKNNKLSKNYYQTVIKYLKAGGKVKEVDGLPYQVIREMARHKDFINAQKSLNFNFDELDRYKKVLYSLNNEKKRIRRRMAQSKQRYLTAKRLLKKAMRTKKMVGQADKFKAQMRNEKQVGSGYKYILGMINDSKKQYKKLALLAKKRMNKRQYNLRERAGRTLVRQLAKMNENISRFLTNNEFLRYEVFAGSGQNIRYQVAGGNVGKTQRIPASVKPKKSLNWSFDGEYWEDEIGAYRSSLKNNCPKVGTGPGLPKRNKDDQAKLSKEFY